MSISRRKFLTWLSTAGVGTAFCPMGTAESGDPASGNKNGLAMDCFAILHDISLCIGCRTCEAACNEVNHLPIPLQSFSDISVLDQERRTTPDNVTIVNRYDNLESSDKPVFRKIQCNHCLSPACVSACFVKALNKTDSGPVVYDPSICVGCRYCMVACPFDIPAYEFYRPFNPRIVKCDMCAPRIEKGLLPACVASCPREALIFGKRSIILKTAREYIRKYPNRYIDHIYGEKEMGGTSWLYISNVPFHELGMKENLGHLPAASLTAGGFGIVPMVLGIWPVLLTGLYAITRQAETIGDSDD